MDLLPAYNEMEAARTPAERREFILRFEEAMHATGETLDCTKTYPIRHHYAGDSYGREMFLPKETIVVGKIHKQRHVNVISQGHVMVYTEQDGWEDLKAPYTFVSPPGTKRVVLVLEDTVWTAIHVTSETDPTKIEAAVIAKSYKELEWSGQLQQLP